MSYTVYVLYSESFQRLYIGMTSHLESRMLSHNQLASKGFTKRYRPWSLIHTEIFLDKPAALAREKALKSGQGRAWIKEWVLPRWEQQQNPYSETTNT